MEETEPYYDFCIPYNQNENEMQATLKELVELGYKTIAIEQTFDHSKKETGKRPSEVFPEPYAIKHLQEEFNGKLRILQRLTILYSNSGISHAMAISQHIKKYNIIAGQPKTDVALTHCCTDFNGDIVTFDPEAGSKLLVNRKAFGVAFRRGMCFEIKYAPLITDSNYRKDIIKVAHYYSLQRKKGKIIISSGARNMFELRGPYEIANLSFIFGLSEDQGKNAVNRTGRLLFLKAESRRMGKTVMFVGSTGPIVFSDESSSDNESEASQSSHEDVKSSKSSVIRNKRGHIASTESQPKKKKCV